MLDIRYLSGLSSHEQAEWQKLWLNASDANLFNSPAWFIVCRQAFPQRRQIAVLVKAEDRLGGVLLLEKRGSHWTLMGRPYMDRAALLLASSFMEQYGHQFISILLKKFKALELCELSTKQLESLLKASEQLLIYSRQDSLNPRFLVNDPALSSKEKREISRLTRRLSERGKWFIEFHSLDENSFSSMCSIEQSSHKVSKNQAILERPEVGKLFTTIGSMSKSYVVFLIHNAKPIAHLLGLIEKDTFLAYHMAYDESWADYAPGKLLIYHLLPELEKKGLLYFDFSRGQNSLKQKFSNIVIPQYTLTIFDKSYIGYFNYCLWKIGELIDFIRLKISSYLPNSLKEKLRLYLRFWLDRRK